MGKADRHYIILGTFFNIGGGQLYTKNKTDYLKQNGWQVHVYTGRFGRLLMEEMREYEDNFIPELDDLPFFTKRKRREEIIDKISGDAGKAECVIIESHKMSLSVWGELSAKRIRARHVIFDLDEEFPEFRKWQYEFLDFKHKRKELSGIKEVSLDRMFGNYKRVRKKEAYYLNFTDTNTFSELHNAVMEDYDKGNIGFGCISRLNKPYIIPMFEQIAKLAERHPEILFSIAFVGCEGEDGILRVIRNIVNRQDNLKLFAYGFLSPVPSKLLEADCFINTAGSACMTACAGKLTVGVDTCTCKPIGILGIDVSEALFQPEGSCMPDLCDYLEDILFHRDFHNLCQLAREKRFVETDYRNEFDRHMEFIRRGDHGREYYDFNNINLKDRIFHYGVSCAGIERIRKIRRRL